MPKVKICGIRSLEDAQKAIEAKADALGFIFVKTSKRFITPTEAALICEKIPTHILTVGVFQNHSQEKVSKIAQLCQLDYLQFHGHEPAIYCNNFPEYKIIKAFAVPEEIPLLAEYEPDIYLLDKAQGQQRGGTGETFDWQLIAKISHHPIMVAGGINPQNISCLLQKASPEWIDLAGGVEKEGKKDLQAMQRIINYVRSVQNEQ